MFLSQESVRFGREKFRRWWVAILANNRGGLSGGTTETNTTRFDVSVKILTVRPQ